MFLALAVITPFLLLSAKHRAGIFQKFGFIPSELSSLHFEQPSIWFHAVSVGEFGGALSLIREFAACNPQYHIFVSTTTATGQAVAKQRLNEAIAANRTTVFYFPFDLPFAICAWLDLIKPEIAVIVETEIWPGFAYECKKRGIKLAMINARMSPRSFSRYMFLRPIFSQAIRKFDLIATQSEEESYRFLKLCAGPHTKESIIEITGNLKYDEQLPLPLTEIKQLQKQLNLTDEDQVLIGGSTHEGEETALLEAYSQLIDNHPNTRLILVPRHPERWEHVCRFVESQGFNPCRYSRQEAFRSRRDVYVLDTIGQLTRYYAVATVAFVGGSLVPIGGHNLVEPFVYKVPVVCGPNLFKTHSVARQLENAGALTVVHNAAQLKTELELLLKNTELRQRKGTAGNDWLKHSAGATEHTLKLLKQVMEHEQNYSYLA
jgi:3-deoxy-D-manno-octulosonic-acid transferase